MSLVMLKLRSKVELRSNVLLLVLFMACVTRSVAQLAPGSGDLITFGGNQFLMSKETRDTLVVVDPITEEEVWKAGVHEPEPLTMNGQKIYRAIDLTSTPLYNRSPGVSSFEEYVLKSVMPGFSGFPPGPYRLGLRHVVIDRKGKVVYYKLDRIDRTEVWRTVRLGNDTLEIIARKIDEAMKKTPPFKPATLKGQKVAALYESWFPNMRIFVENEKVTCGKD